MEKHDKNDNAAPGHNHGTLENIREAVQARVAQEKAGAQDNAGGWPVPKPSDFTLCLKERDRGSGYMFNLIHGDSYAFCPQKGRGGTWYVWNGVHWETDIFDQALNAVGDVALAFEHEALRLAAEPETKERDKLRDRLERRAEHLRADRGMMTCLKYAHVVPNVRKIHSADMDRRPYLLACKNGVVDLLTGEMFPGRQDDMLTKACPTAWEGLDAPCPTWERTLLEIYGDDQALYEFIQRAFGMGLIGEVVLHRIFFLDGPGANGKSLLQSVIQDVLGPFACSVEPELFLTRNRVNSNAPRAELMALHGARIAFTSETDEGVSISPSVLKKLTGNDRVSGRNPHDQYQTEFRQSHTLFFGTNHIPRVPADDYATWRRMLVVPHRIIFVDDEPRAENERKANPHLGAELLKEAPGILAWMVKGCLLFQQEGLKPPPAVLDATRELRAEFDTIQKWIDERCVEDRGLISTSKDLYEDFKEWWVANVSKNIPSHHRFGRDMKKRFERHGGKSYPTSYSGIALKQSGLTGE